MRPPYGEVLHVSKTTRNTHQYGGFDRLRRNRPKFVPDLSVATATVARALTASSANAMHSFLLNRIGAPG
jgi:hypothetical protein